jgi:hypothetical protein
VVKQPTNNEVVIEMLWNFYIAHYRNENKWNRHVRKHTTRFKRIMQLSLSLPDEIFYRDVNLTLLFAGEPELVIFEPQDFTKKFVLHNSRTGWMLLLLATDEEKIILTSFFLTEANTPEDYFKLVKGYREISPETRIEEIVNGSESAGYYRRPTEEEKEFLRQLRSQCRYVGC